MSKKNIFLALLVAIALVSKCFAADGYLIQNGKILDYTMNIYGDEESYQTGEGNVELPDEKIVSFIDIDWNNGSINMKYYEGNSVYIAETSGSTLSRSVAADESLRYKFQDNTLYIKYCKSGYTFDSTLEKKLTIFIPKDMTINTVQINTVCAATTIEGIKIKNLKIYSIGGFARVNIPCDVLKVDAYMVRKDFTLKAPFVSDCHVKLIDSNASIDCDKISKLNVESVKGNLLVFLPEDLEWEAKIKTTTGKIEVPVELAKVAYQEWKAKNGTKNTCKFNIETITGDVKICNKN